MELKTSDLKDCKTGIFGIQGSGKTHWAITKIKGFKHPLVFAINKDDGWSKLKGAYVYNADRLDLENEFKRFIDWAWDLAQKGLIDLLIIDEADLFFQSNYDLKGKHLDLVLNHRHFGLAIWYMTRRPQDIPTKIVESCKNLVIFKLEGKNAIDRFSDIHPKIPELIGQLDYKKHDFVVKEIGKEPYISPPLN